MESKTTTAKKIWLSGDKIRALKMIKNFKIGLTQSDKQTLQIAAECYSGNESFYNKIGHDTTSIKIKAESIAKTLLGL